MQTQPRILIVDDDENNLKLLSLILQKLGYTLETAIDGKLALEKLKIRPPDVMLLDLMMPGIDGQQVLKTMKEDERMKEIPVIIVSAVRDRDTVLQCIDMGARDYMIKPYDQELVRSRVQAVLSEKRIKDLEIALEKCELKAKQLELENERFRNMPKESATS